MTEYLKYKIYNNKGDYSELILTNPYFAVQLGVTKVQTGLDDFNCKMIFKIVDHANIPEIIENINLFEQFLQDAAFKISSFNEIEKIEISVKRPENNNITRYYVFNKGEFKDLEMGYTSYIYSSQALISFTINSMEQNFNSQVITNG